LRQFVLFNSVLSFVKSRWVKVSVNSGDLLLFQSFLCHLLFILKHWSRRCYWCLRQRHRERPACVWVRVRSRVRVKHPKLCGNFILVGPWALIVYLGRIWRIILLFCITLKPRLAFISAVEYRCLKRSDFYFLPIIGLFLIHLGGIVEGVIEVFELIAWKIQCLVVMEMGCFPILKVTLGCGRVPDRGLRLPLELRVSEDVDVVVVWSLCLPFVVGLPIFAANIDVGVCVVYTNIRES